MALLDDIKPILRISNIAYDNEILDLIEAAKADLGLSGVLTESIIDVDPLIKRAITLYCKTNFGWSNADSEKLQASYDSLKTHLSLSTDYSFFKTTFIVKDSTTSDPVRLAKVILKDTTLTTDAEGKAVFCSRKENNCKYLISADGYITDDDDLNLIDITNSNDIEILMTRA